MRVSWPDGDRPEELRPPGYMEQMELDVLHEMHQQADHGVHAIEALVYCHEARVQPPRWLVDWLGERCASWLDNHAPGLDEALELKSPGRGKPPPLKRLEAQAAGQWDAWLMYILNRGIGISVEKAAELVWARRHCEGRAERSVDWLEESFHKYGKHWAAQREQDAWDHGVSAHFDANTPEGAQKRRQFLSTFPDEALRQAGLK